MPARRNIILGVLGAIILGALLGREFPLAGLAVSASAIMAYVAMGARATVGRLRRWRSSGWEQRAQAAIPLIMLLAVAGSFFSHEMPYFIILVLLLAEYMIYDK